MVFIAPAPVFVVVGVIHMGNNVRHVDIQRSLTRGGFAVLAELTHINRVAVSVLSRLYGGNFHQIPGFHSNACRLCQLVILIERHLSEGGVISLGG